MQSVHTVKCAFELSSFENERYSSYFELYKIHDFRTQNNELRTAKSKHSEKALLGSCALRTKSINGVLPILCIILRVKAFTMLEQGSLDGCKECQYTM